MDDGFLFVLKFKKSKINSFKSEFTFLSYLKQEVKFLKKNFRITLAYFEFRKQYGTKL